MAFLKDLSIVSGPNLPDFRYRRFLDCIRHIEKLFHFYLCDSQKYVLDGMSRVYVEMGPRDKTRGYVNYPREKMSKIDTPAFSLDEFLAREVDQRDEFTTKTVEKALLKIAKTCGADPKPIRAAAKAIREGGYAGFIPWPGEKTPHPKKAIVAQTGYYHHGQGRARARVQLCDLAGHLIATADVPTEVADKNPFFNGFKTSKWRDSVFQFCSDKNRSLYQTDLSEFVDAALDRKKSKATTSQKDAVSGKASTRKSSEAKDKLSLLKKVLTEARKSSRVPTVKELTGLMGTSWAKSADGKAYHEALKGSSKIMEDDDDDDLNAMLEPLKIDPAMMDGQEFDSDDPQVVRSREMAMDFLKALAVGDGDKAYVMLSSEACRRLKKPQFLKRVEAFYRCADPGYNPGMTLRKIQPHLYVNVEDPEIALEYAPDMRYSGLKAPVLWGLEAGCEGISREGLFLFVVKENGRIKLELTQGS